MFLSNISVSSISIKRHRNRISGNELKEYSISLNAIKGNKNDEAELSCSSAYQLKMSPFVSKEQDFGQAFWYNKLFEFLNLPHYYSRKIMPKLFVKKDTYELLGEEAEVISAYYILSYNLSVLLEPSQYDSLCKAYKQETEQKKIIIKDTLTKSGDFYIPSSLTNLIIGYIGPKPK